VSADGARLQQVLLNLIENAAQHSPAGSRIILHIVEAAGQRVTIQVGDAGKGISPEKIERVFEPFFTTRTGGTGLGLSLVKHFVESMGGEVMIRNNDPPPGCTVELVLSIAKEDGGGDRETENTVN
jgi:signal transduction histidine kinase